jgi:hypothetical protein
MRRLVVIPAAIAVALIPGTASANAYTADATCAGFTLNMERTEADTVVTVTRNGHTVRTVTNDTFGAPVSLSIPSPDQTVTQAWTVVIDSRWNEDYTFSETVAPCVTPTTVTPTTTQVTVPPSSTTSTTPPPSTVPTDTTVAVGPPPTPATVVVTPPRTPAPTTSVPTTFTLPETGVSLEALVLALVASATGVFLLLVRRRGGGL